MARSDVAMTAGTVVLVLLGFGGLTAGCAPGADGNPAHSGGSGAASTSTAGTPEESRAERPRLPPGFPVMPGALPAQLADDDPGLIAAWTVEEPGAAAYDFYVGALRAAGFQVEGLYPGGEWAIIRFRIGDGAVWQLVVHGTGVEVRLDRP